MKTLITILLLGGFLYCCKKDNDSLQEEVVSPCKGITDTLKVDSIFITLYEDCSGTPAANRMIFADHNRDIDYPTWVRDTIYTDENGLFSYVWYGFCENDDILEFRDFANSFTIYMGTTPVDGNTSFAWTLNDTVHTAVQFHFLSPHSPGDTLWFARHQKYYIGYLAAPFTDTIVYLPPMPLIHNYFIRDDSASVYFDWNIGWENFYHTFSILQPGEHQFKIYHVNCDPVDEVEITVE